MTDDADARRSMQQSEENQISPFEALGQEMKSASARLLAAAQQLQAQADEYETLCRDATALAQNSANAKPTKAKPTKAKPTRANSANAKSPKPLRKP